MDPNQLQNQNYNRKSSLEAKVGHGNNNGVVGGVINIGQKNMEVYSHH